jgi:tRNA pseudouridine65 synthase
MDRYQAAADYANRIESERRALNAWKLEPPPASAFESQAAFLADTMTFYQWLQFVLLPRVREIVERRRQFPRESSVGPTLCVGWMAAMQTAD